MRKLISLFFAMLVALSTYSQNSEYTIIGKQFNTVVINVPAYFVIEKGEEHSVKITNESYEYFSYDIVNDTLVIKSKYRLDTNIMEAKQLKVQLTHPNPSMLYQSIIPQGRGLSKVKRTRSGNQN
jgi:hypothetical protein